MAVSPFALFRRRVAADGGVAADDLTETEWLYRRELAGVYRACAQLGFTPREVDEMELWEIAAVLYPDGDDSPDSAADGRAMLVARAKALEAGRPVPEWGPLTEREQAEWAAFAATSQPVGMPRR